MPRHPTFWLASVILALPWAGSPAAAADRPNVVLFVADDHGQDAGCYGNRVIRTPNLDQFAHEGTLYRYAFCTTASCSASRSVILSGLHNHLTGQYGHAHSFHHFVMYYPMRVIRTDRYKLILNIAHQLPYPFASDLYQSATWQSVKADPERTHYGKRRLHDFIHRPRYELYDLQTDPDEVINRATDPRYAEVFRELAQKLKDFQKRARDPWFVKYEYE